METFYSSEFNFICKTLEKLRVKVLTLSLNEPALKVFDNDLSKAFFKDSNLNASLKQYLNNPLPKTVYYISNSLKLNYVYFLLPNELSVAVIGPYLSEPITHRQITEICERIGCEYQKRHSVYEFYLSIPTFSQANPVFIMLDTFFEKIWQTSDFLIVSRNLQTQFLVSSAKENEKNDSEKELLLVAKNMEKRYEFENQLMKAVELGHIHEETRIFSIGFEGNFEARTADPLRNAKNYTIIMNTLLRKSAEKGGVHPIFIDKVSSNFAKQIEQMRSLSSINSLMREMFVSYCRLVRKHSIRKYSPTVQKAILIIESDLSADISTKQIAKTLKISLGYLCSVFKKETQKTVSDYVREKRINNAINLLNTTQMQVQTIASHCGIMDVQYFSKIFKKVTGKTPKEYRESVRQLNGEYV